MNAKAAETNADHAQVVAPPPAIYALGLAAGLLIEWVFPVAELAGSIAFIGAITTIGGTALGIWFLATFRRARTPVDPNRPAVALVTSGPFQYSRNPGYLSLLMMYVGIALWLDAVWPFLFLPGVIVIIHRGVIRREERYLEAKFGEPYRDYRGHTRRWV